MLRPAAYPLTVQFPSDLQGQRASPSRSYGYTLIGGNTLCLFADGHTELLDTDNMTSEERRKYFQRDEN
jgi:hypothetical protein